MSQTWGDLYAAGVTGAINLAGDLRRGAGALVSGEVPIADLPGTIGRGIDRLGADTARGAEEYAGTIGATVDAIPETVGAVVGAVPGVLASTSRGIVGIAVIAVAGAAVYFGRR